MMFDDLVAEQTTSEGTGNLTLAAGSGGFRRFSDVFGTGSGNLFFYHLRHSNALEWEVGRGYMADSSTLVRQKILKSSDSGAAVDFSPGTKELFGDLPADMATVTGGIARLVYNASGAQIAAGKLVSLAAFNGSEGLSQIELADHSADNRRAHGFVPAAIQNDSAGFLLSAGEFSGHDTAGEDDGAPIFLGTAGDFTVGPPTGGVVQEVGTVVNAAASGTVVFNVLQQGDRRFASDWIAGRTYWPLEMVIESGLLYRCNQKHISDAASFANDGLKWDQIAAPTSGTAVEGHYFLEVPEVKAYSLIFSAGSAFTVTSLSGKTSSGSVTLTLKINGTAVDGIDGQVYGTVKATQAASGAGGSNAVSGGDELTIDITGVAAPADFRCTLLGTAT